jgi:hypothetical protein
MRTFVLGFVAAAAALLLAPAAAQAATPVHYPSPAPAPVYPGSPDDDPSVTPGCSFTPRYYEVGDGVEAFCRYGPGFDYRVVARCENSRTEWLEFGRIAPIGRGTSLAQCGSSSFDPGRVVDYRVDFF